MKKRRMLFLSTFSIFLYCCSNYGSYSQPILYNHKKHIEEAGLTCFDCHLRVGIGEKASIPNIEVCQNCHKEPMTNSKEEAKLVLYINKKENIPWVQVHQLPDYVYFSHRRHVAMGKIACQECHGNVAGMTLPFSRAAVDLKMEFCTQCHEKNRVNTDCATCHR